jgi:ribosome-binding factor A
MKGNRLSRVADLIKKEVARILMQRMRDPRLGFLTITGVDVATDLRNATIHVSMLGDDDAKFDENLVILNKAAPWIRYELRELHLDLRNLPELRFKADKSLARAARVQALLREVAAEPRPEPPPAPGAPAPDAEDAE